MNAKYNPAIASVVLNHAVGLAPRINPNVPAITTDNCLLRVMQHFLAYGVSEESK